MRTSILLSVSIASLAVPVVAGGIERFCPSGTGGGTSVTEAWPNPTSVPWVLAGAGAGNFPAPGFAHIQCAGNPPTAASPVCQSLYNAIATWNTAGLGTSVPNVSSFSFATPATPPTVGLVTNPLLPANEGGLVPLAWWNLNRNAVGLPSRDNLNTITLWDGAGSFTANMGGPAALAITGVFANVSNGTILETDVALNARAPFTFTGAPTWSFVETNTALGVTMATQAVNLTGTFVLPTAGFADLAGVLTHELGHFAGLGHSLVDSTVSPSVSEMPTMFAIAQPVPNFAATLSLFTNGTPGSCNFNTVTVSTNLNLLGLSARDLTLDDKFAIAEGYPLPPSNPFWSNTGILTGTVFSTAGTPLRGASVIAVDAASPNKNRVGTLTFDTGNYTIVGLPPGNYFVMVQQVDTGTPGSYFLTSDVPNYVQPASFFGCTGAAPPLLTTEWWDVGETNPEFSNSNASTVAITGGQTTVATFKLNSDVNHLSVSATGNPAAASPRGAQLALNGTATFFIGGATPGSTVFLWTDTTRTFTTFGTQLSDVSPVAVFSGPANAAGVATIAVPTNSTHLNNNLFAQGMFVDAAGNLILTNSVSVWVR